MMEEDREYQNRRICFLYRVVWEGLAHEAIFKHRSEEYGGGSHIRLPREEYFRLREQQVQEAGVCLPSLQKS